MVPLRALLPYAVLTGCSFAVAAPAAPDPLAANVTVYRDAYGVPHIVGETEEATFPDFGSNQWAIAPEKSANGSIMHVEHLHMPWANRFQKYEAHLLTPGKLDAGGVSWFGSPFFLAGFNEKITWSRD